MSNIEEWKSYEELNYINKLLNVKSKFNVITSKKIKKDLMSFSISEYPFLKSLEENFTSKYDLLENVIKNYSKLNKQEKEYIDVIYIYMDEKYDSIIWDNISVQELTQKPQKINLVNFNDRIESICYCKYYYENFHKFSENEKNDFFELIDKNVIYLLINELNKEKNKKNDEILKNTNLIKKYYECINNDNNLQKDLHLEQCLNLIINNKNGKLLMSFIKNFNNFSIKAFVNNELLKDNRLFYEKYFCYLNPEYIYDSSLKKETTDIIFEKITPKKLNLIEDEKFLHSLNKSIINFIEYYLEIDKDITKEILFNENVYFKNYFKNLLKLMNSNYNSNSNIFEVIINCTDDYNLKIKLINAYKEEFFEENNINKLLILLDKNNILSKFIIENVATLDIDKQKLLLFNYMKDVILENKSIDSFKENIQYMNKNLLNIFDLNFSCSILSSMFEEKESFILDVKNIVEKVKLKNKLEENLTEKNNYSRVKI